MIRYLDQLRILAANWPNLDSTTRTSMKSATFLLAVQRVPIQKKVMSRLGGLNGGVDDEYERQWTLAKASDIALLDNISMVQYFSSDILAAPEVGLFYLLIVGLALTSCRRAF
jgi:hypothetical protein